MSLYQEALLPELLDLIHREAIAECMRRPHHRALFRCVSKAWYARDRDFYPPEWMARIYERMKETAFPRIPGIVVTTWRSILLRCAVRSWAGMHTLDPYDTIIVGSLDHQLPDERVRPSVSIVVHNPTMTYYLMRSDHAICRRATTKDPTAIFAAAERWEEEADWTHEPDDYPPSQHHTFRIYRASSPDAARVLAKDSRRSYRVYVFHHVITGTRDDDGSDDGDGADDT